MCETLPQTDCEEMGSEKSTYSPEDSLVNLTALLANALRQMMTGICGESVQGCFATFTRDGRCLKTYRGYCQVNLDGSFDEFSGKWPRHGMMLSGQLMELPMLGRRTKGTGYSSSGTGRMWMTPQAGQCGMTAKTSGRPLDKSTHLQAQVYVVQNWPTPRANDAEKRGEIANDIRNGLPAAVKHWPTATARDWKSGKGKKQAERGRKSGATLSEVLGGTLNADWVECLMNFPIGWTDIDYDSPRKWPGWPAPLGINGSNDIWPTPQASTGTADLNWKATDVRNRPNKIGRAVNITETGQYSYEPPRVITGQKNRAKRLKCCGNAVVPRQTYPVFAAIVEIEYLGGFDDVDIDSESVPMRAMRPDTAV
jgi:hypothetical protein